eukprot:CAMPEP_0196768072 /NCGR_PEP_ID=MMETSP1095-20130614/42309_1 /TAXON_ID=96789 ORGANISM="Chromulina nebulosa, Strain UTEXLB2642" /NCGR_SAMPLE_ID=MMETSP1095 /ASSEMBLY_ACC=CAM_ASM_000446 /LENGTH=75 /DNA_ID=CAMNT_0042137135 /DNA_START=329 /DNA_END=556 /DNA_ORIENTATION=+
MKDGVNEEDQMDMKLYNNKEGQVVVSDIQDIKVKIEDINNGIESINQTIESNMKEINDVSNSLIMDDNPDKRFSE